MQVQSTLPSEKHPLPLQVDEGQSSLPQDVAPQRLNRFLRTAFGFAVLGLIGLAACVLLPLASQSGGQVEAFMGGKIYGSWPLWVWVPGPLVGRGPFRAQTSSPDSQLAFHPILPAVAPVGNRAAGACSQPTSRRSLLPGAKQRLTASRMSGATATRREKTVTSMSGPALEQRDDLLADVLTTASSQDKAADPGKGMLNGVPRSDKGIKFDVLGRLPALDRDNILSRLPGFGKGAAVDSGRREVATLALG